jgi:CRP-like cAMP-binding protein
VQGDITQKEHEPTVRPPGDYKLDLKDYLEKTFQLDEREWYRVIESRFEVQHVPKGEFVVSEGKVSRWLSYIAEGVIRYLRFEENGDETTCYFLSEHGFVGDPESFELQKPSRLNAQAVTDCTLVSFSYESRQYLSKNSAEFNRVMAAIDRKTMMDLLAQRDFLLNRDAASKYQHFITHYPDILRRAPLGFIASYLDITQQSLSRLRKQLT